MELRIHMIFVIIVIAVKVWLVVIASLIIYSLCATVIDFKYSLFYQIFITVSPDEQIVKYILEHSQLEVPVFFIWMLFVTPLLFTTCVQMDSYVQLMCHTSLPYLWPSIIYSFREASAIFYSWDGVTYWHFPCSNTHLPYEGPVQYLQSLCCPCTMWNLIIIYISCTLNNHFSESGHIFFGISYCV